MPLHVKTSSTSTEKPPIKQVAVIGAGQMGTGIAQVCATAGYAVVLFDLTATLLENAKVSISRNLDRLVTRGDINASRKTEILELLSVSEDYKDLGTADIVIEATPEDDDIKARLYQDIEPHLKAQAILASNTSSLSITRLGSLCHRPNQMMGVHFMNPATIMPLVEIIRGLKTDDETADRVYDFVASLDKHIVESLDSPGFIVNRLLIPMINEAIFTLYEGIGSVEDIDHAMRFGANHPLGPLELADLIGLDTCLAIMRTLHQGFGEGKYRPCPLLVQYVEAGWLGRKTKRGFYDYTANQA